MYSPSFSSEPTSWPASVPGSGALCVAVPHAVTASATASRQAMTQMRRTFTAAEAYRGRARPRVGGGCASVGTAALLLRVGGALAAPLVVLEDRAQAAHRPCRVALGPRAHDQVLHDLVLQQ